MSMDPKGEIAAGGADGALDMTDRRDQATLRKATYRWPKRIRAVTDERVTRWVEGLDVADEVARRLVGTGEPVLAKEGARLLVDTAKTGAVFIAMNQRDDHKAADLEAGDRRVEAQGMVDVYKMLLMLRAQGAPKLDRTGLGADG